MNRNNVSATVVQVSLLGMPQKETGGPLRVIYDLSAGLMSTGNVNCRFLSSHYAMQAEKLSQVVKDVPQKDDEIHPRSLRRIFTDQLQTTYWGQFLKNLVHRHRIRKNWYALSENVSLVHAHEAVVAGMLFPIIGIPKVLTVHSKGGVTNDRSLPPIKDGWVGRFSKQLQYFESLGVKLADIVVFPSASARDLFSRDRPQLLDGKRTEIIYNGVALSPIREPKNRLGLGSNRPVQILMVCAMVRQKRFDRCVGILKALEAIDVKFDFVHVGTGPLESEWKSSCRKAGLGSFVEFRGSMNNRDVQSLMDQSDVLLSTSEHVVFDLVILEAMAAGLPVVASRDGGNKEAVRHGESGFLCEPDDIGSYVQALQALIDEPPRRRDMGKKGRDRIMQHFQSSTMVENYRKVYDLMIP